MMTPVKTPIQLASAALIVFAVLVVLVYPWTIGPPAPNLSYSPLSALLAAALSVVLLILLDSARRVLAVIAVPLHVEPVSARLALICTRLC
jgi:hypothetical protein